MPSRSAARDRLPCSSASAASMIFSMLRSSGCPRIDRERRSDFERIAGPAPVHGLGQVAQSCLLPLPQEAQRFDHVAQLADVSGPPVAHEDGTCGAREARRDGPVPGRELPQELRHQRQDVASPFPQRGDSEGDALDPVVEIGTESPGAHLLVQRAKRGAKHADVGLVLRRSADAHEPSVLEEAQQLGLHRDGHLADLVEEQRAALCGLDLPSHALRRAREGSALVAKELALEEGVGDRGTVDWDERPRPSSGRLVSTSGENLLARPAFAHQGDRHVLRRDRPEHAIELAHHRRLQDGLEDHVKVSRRPSHRLGF